MHRQIKKFDDDSLKFKSSELRAFLLYLAVPVFFNSLDNSYFYLLLTYVGAIRFLYEPIQNEADINLAEELLRKYVYEFEQHFGERAFDFTLHAHLHLAEQVRNHGPLHGHSQFVFEVKKLTLFMN